MSHATASEREMPLPGDDFVAEPASQVTRAITIDAAPEDVWPWLAQIGADRGGFYSYDWLENLFRLGIHSADRVVPEWQTRAVGEFVFANRAGTGGWYVQYFRPNDAVVMKLANPKKGEPARRDEGLRWEFLWTFAVRPSDDGRTRLIIRERVAFDGRIARWLMTPLGLVSGLMTRKMMRGIRGRAERRAPERVYSR